MPALYFIFDEPVVETKTDFSNFLNTCYRCFIESIDNYGKSIKENKYFWDVIKNAYPKLFDSFLRIRVYRHEMDHLDLIDSVNEQFQYFRKIDLEGHLPSQIDDLYFTLQQRVLDAFLLGIQSEITRLS